MYSHTITRVLSEHLDVFKRFAFHAEIAEFRALPIAGTQGRECVVTFNHAFSSAELRRIARAYRYANPNDDRALSVLFIHLSNITD